MLNEYQISNFKAFAGPETVPIRPITLIFGPNSSGKSSILQSLLMLKQTLDDRENSQTPLLFKGDLVDLGSYRELIWRHDVERTFSLKTTFALPANLDDPFQYPWIVEAWGGGGLSRLEESLKDFESVAIRLSFSQGRDRLGVDVCRIELFLGDDPAPIITYEREPLSSANDDRANQLRSKNLNEKHVYWSSYWKTFDEADDTFVRKVIEDALVEPLVMGIRALEKMTPQERKIFLNELTAIAESQKDARDQVEETVSQVIPEYSQKEKDRILGLSGLELALEAYKMVYEFDMLKVRKFLPERLNNYEMDDILTSFGGSLEDSEGFSRNLSIVTLTVGQLVRRALERVLYIGPLRSCPERYFMFSGVSASYVGRSGRFVPDILVSDRELLTKVNDQLERFDLGYELKLSSLCDQSSDIEDLFALRLYEKSTGVHVGMTDVGFGFSQVLPIM